MKLLSRSSYLGFEIWIYQGQFANPEAPDQPTLRFAMIVWYDFAEMLNPYKVHAVTYEGKNPDAMIVHLAEEWCIANVGEQHDHS